MHVAARPTRHQLVGQLLVCCCLVGCARDDLSQYLSSGRCDDQQRCADGFQCDRDTWECRAIGAAHDAGRSDGQPDALADAFLPEVPDARPTDGASVSSPDACPPGGCSCAEGLTNCGGQCVALATSSAHCGSCGATCVLGAVNLACGTFVAGTCDCAGDDARCGTSGGASRCEATTGLCVCGGTTCAHGEVCGLDGTGKASCRCDGLTTCTQGMTCCVGYGCADLGIRPDHCGTCGNACPARHYCQNGSCRCRNANSCDAGAAGVCTSQGRCQCDGVECAPGQRCVAPGVCGP